MHKPPGAILTKSKREFPESHIVIRGVVFKKQALPFTDVNIKAFKDQLIEGRFKVIFLKSLSQAQGVPAIPSPSSSCLPPCPLQMTFQYFAFPLHPAQALTSNQVPVPFRRCKVSH